MSGRKGPSHIRIAAARRRQLGFEFLLALVQAVRPRSPAVSMSYPGGQPIVLRSYRQTLVGPLKHMNQHAPMITIHPKALAKLIVTQRDLDLIDVRPRAEFNRVHIRGARSVPLAALHPAKVLHERVGAKSDPVFLICWNRMRASMAAGLLREAGCQHPVVLDGGMELWANQGLPVVNPIRFEAPALVKALARAAQPRTPRLHRHWSKRLTELEHFFFIKPATNVWWWLCEDAPGDPRRREALHA
jgi:rhodanese-related sulfurtransferase